MASDNDFLCDHFGVLKAQNARDDLRAKFASVGTGPFSEWLATAKADPELARFFEHQPEISGAHPALFSLAEQAKLIDQRGKDGAAQFMRDNGSELGKLLPRPKDDADNIKGVKNPWSNEWRGGEDKRQAEQIRIIKSNTKLATSLARACGKTISNQPLRGK